MSFIVTGDFQAEFGNLDLCQQAWDEILAICMERNVWTVVVAGDLKHHYDPVSIRVIKWWQNAIRRARRKHIKVVVVLGNHDRVGPYASADNWLSILKRAGAIVYDQPDVLELEDCRLFILPFDSPTTINNNAKGLLAYKPDKKKDVLIFHCDIKDTEYNRHGTKSVGINTPSSIFHSKYRFCIGAHVHFPQRFAGNCYFVGSPFCTDWGEVNQQKRYLVVDRRGIRSIHSKIPRWFDPDVGGFNITKPSTWKGSRIRIQVTCDASTDYGRRLEKIRKRAEGKYRGAYVYVVPKFKESVGQELAIKTTDSDEYKINAYFQETKPRKIHRSTCIKYMLKALSKSTSSMRHITELEFEYAKARNFLSYEKLYLDFKRRGVVCIQGINEDRAGKSNGSGKTSLVQTIPVCFFGRSFKGQKADAWKNRWNDEHAYVEIGAKAHHKKIKIRRERKPTALRMEVDGRHVESGMKSTDKHGTQEQIEQLTGYTWSTLANAVYIDRGIADAFISGTRAERTNLLSRFQNLERFERALAYTKREISNVAEKQQSSEVQLERVRSTIAQLKNNIDDVQSVQDEHIKDLKDAWDRTRKEKGKWLSKHIVLKEKLKRKEQLYEQAYASYQKKHIRLGESHAIAQREFEQETEISGRWLRVSRKKICPTCSQPVSKHWVKKHTKDLQHTFDTKRAEWDKVSDLRRSWNQKMLKAEAKFDSIQERLTKLERKEKDFDINIQHLYKQYKQANHAQGEAQWVIEKTKRKLERLQDEKAVLKDKLHHYYSKMRMLLYVQSAFSRDGIPAFLNRQLCPVLNKAASYYADLFSDSEIQVQFMVEGGEFVPKIINPRGGDSIEDQSTGEKALAGLIASFALREVAPKCNILILDEPGEGLDAQTARQFAASLQTLKKRFGTIFVCTHNQHILSELSTESIITVRKKNKISRLEEH